MTSKSLKIAQIRPVSCPREGQQASNMRGAQRISFCHDTILHTPRMDRRSTDNAPRPLPATGLTIYGISHTPRSYQAAVRDLRVEAVSNVTFATVWPCHHDTHRYPLLALSTQDKHMPCLVCPWRCAWLLFGFC